MMLRGLRANPTPPPITFSSGIYTPLPTSQYPKVLSAVGSDASSYQQWMEIESQGRPQGYTDLWIGGSQVGCPSPCAPPGSQPTSLQNQVLANGIQVTNPKSGTRCSCPQVGQLNAWGWPVPSGYPMSLFPAAAAPAGSPAASGSPYTVVPPTLAPAGIGLPGLFAPPPPAIAPSSAPNVTSGSGGNSGGGTGNTQNSSSGGAGDGSGAPTPASSSTWVWLALAAAGAYFFLGNKS